MFEGFRIKRRMLMVAHSWDLSINDLHFEDKLALTIIVHIMNIKDKSKIFKNKFVCADAALLSTFYAFRRMYDFNFTNSSTKKVILRVCNACITFFRLSNSDMSRILNNRRDTFLDTLLEVDSLAEIAKEASMLFTYDVKENDYVEYTPNTPVLLVGFDKMFQIQAEANLFFQTMGTMIDNLFANEKPNSENGTVIDHYLGTVTQEMLEDYALGLGISLETALFLVNQYRRMSGVSELDRALFDL